MQPLKSFSNRPKNSMNSNNLEFKEDLGYTKILNFFLENNISYNIINSNTFKDLLNYYNK